MAERESIRLWSTTAASNATSDPNINWAEQQLPGTVNNSARSQMAAHARNFKDTNGSLTTGGSANAYTLTINGTQTAYATGQVVSFKASFTNTSTATLNITNADATVLGAKAIRGQGDTALSVGEIVSGGRYTCQYDATANGAAGAWLLTNTLTKTIYPTWTGHHTYVESGTSYGGGSGVDAFLFFDLANYSNNFKRAIDIFVNTNSTSGTINTGGILVDIYTPPDNGGDCSGLYVKQTGGGNGLSVYNIAADAPGGQTQYPNNGRAIEIAVDGTKIGVDNTITNGVAYIANLGGSGTAYLARPTADTSLTRRAFQVTNAAGGTEKFYVDLAGNIAGTTLTTTNPDAPAIDIRSGASGSYARATVGRTAAELNIVVAGNSNQFIAGTVAGDTIISASTDLWLGVNAAIGAIGVHVTAAGVSLFPGSVRPSTNDGGALGASSLQWSDLFLAEGGVINWDNGDVTITQTGNVLSFAGASTRYEFDAAIAPSSNDGAALGTTALQFSDLFLAEGGVINWDNGDVTITQTDNVLSFAGAATRYEFDANITPSSSDGAALGTTALMFSDAFLASGAVLNFNNGNYTVTHSAGNLAFSGAITLGTALAVAQGGTGVTAGFPAFYASAGANVNLNVAGDNAITIPLPAGYTRIGAVQVYLSGASGDISTATYGLFTATGGGGTAIIAAGTAITVTTGSDNTNGNMQLTSQATINTQSFLPISNTLYFRVGTTVAQTVNVQISYRPLP